MHSNKKISTFLFGLFAIILITGALITDWFQGPSLDQDLMQKYSRLYNVAQLGPLSSLAIINRKGSFDLNKSSEEHWKLVSPKEFPANSNIPKQILLDLQGLQLKKVIDATAINLKNFLLDQPTVKLILNFGTGLSEEIHFGITNSINNTSYVYIPERKSIFNVSSPKLDYESIDLPSLVESHIFDLKMKNFKTLKLTRGSLERGYTRLNIKYEGDDWLGRKNVKLSEDKIKSFLTEVSKIKSYIILDELNEKQEKEIKRALAYPSFAISIEGEDKNTKYTISRKIASLPNLSLSGESLIVKASDREYTYVIESKHFKTFDTKEASLKGLSVKKLFY